MLLDQELTTEIISKHVSALQHRFLTCLPDTVLADAELLNPLDEGPHARFLAFRNPSAQRWYEQLMAKNCVTDVRGDVLRIGFAIYQDEEDVDRLLGLLENLD
jgi:selenocysteine lyase/cysteine desulfurase